jgi:hypothetical protein
VISNYSRVETILPTVIIVVAIVTITAAWRRIAIASRCCTPSFNWGGVEFLLNLVAAETAVGPKVILRIRKSC